MDELITRAGSFGVYQRGILAIVGYISALCGFTQFMTVFNNAVPKFVCTLKNNISTSSYHLPLTTCDAYLNFTVSGTDSPYQCAFSTEFYGQTIVSEWYLICDKIKLANLPATIYQIGALSSIVSGFLSDRYGRRKLCLLMSAILFTNMLICELLQMDSFGLAWNIQYILYGITQFVAGMSVYSLDMVTFVLLIELTVPANANPIGIFNFIFYVVGELILLIVCFYARNWHTHNQFSAAFTFISTLMIVTFLPESPRFLVVKHRLTEAAQVVLKIAKYNGKQDQITYESVMTELSQIINNQDKISNENTLMISRTTLNHSLKDQNELVVIKSTTKNQQSLLEYLSHPFRNAVNAVFSAYICMSIILVYYGAKTGITSIVDNFDPYLMFLLTCISEFIGYLIAIFGQTYSNRNKLGISLLVSGFSALTVALIPLPSPHQSFFNLNTIAIVVFASISKIFISIALFIMYVYPAQIFPTSVRNTLVGFILCSGKLGGIIAPQINLLRFTVCAPMPYFIFGINTVLASVAIMFLPNEKLIRHDI